MFAATKNRYLVFILLLSVWGCASVKQTSVEMRENLGVNEFISPNFIVILLDDFGWSSMSAPMDLDLPAAKSDYYLTPNIDALLDSGMRFSSGYASSPVCSPTRYAIQFGQTPARLGRTRVMGKNKVDHDQVSIAQMLKRVNGDYRAAHIGKWHIGAPPSRYGYDLHDGDTTNKEGGFDNPRKKQWGGYAEDDPKRVYSLTERAIAFMQSAVNQDAPFFLQLSHYAVHSNIVYSQERFEAFNNIAKGSMHTDQGYAAMVSDLDASIGMLLNAYQALGLAQNTYLVLVSDNGGMPVLPMQVNKGRPYPQGLNGPLLRGKWDLMEGGIRVPFAMIGPGIPQRSQSKTPVVTHDLLPTFYELAGGELADLPEYLDGGSFKALFDNPNGEVSRTNDSLVFHFPHYNRVGMNEPHSAIISDGYKLVYFPASERHLLFNLSNDAAERNNLSESHPEKVRDLLSKLQAYLSDVNAEKAIDSESWGRIGEDGTVRTRFFERYQ